MLWSRDQLGVAPVHTVISYTSSAQGCLSSRGRSDTFRTLALRSSSLWPGLLEAPQSRHCPCQGDAAGLWEPSDGGRRLGNLASLSFL